MYWEWERKSGRMIGKGEKHERRHFVHAICVSFYPGHMPNLYHAFTEALSDKWRLLSGPYVHKMCSCFAMKPVILVMNSWMVNHRMAILWKEKRYVVDARAHTTSANPHYPECTLYTLETRNHGQQISHSQTQLCNSPATWGTEGQCVANLCSKVLKGKMVQFIVCKVSCTTTCIHESWIFILLCLFVWLFPEK